METCNKLMKKYWIGSTSHNHKQSTIMSTTKDAVSWCDGDLSQIDAITNSILLFENTKIVANKQYAAQSEDECPADVSRVFKRI
jgi:hypothetical protein